MYSTKLIFNTISRSHLLYIMSKLWIINIVRRNKDNKSWLSSKFDIDARYK